MERRYARRLRQEGGWEVTPTDELDERRALALNTIIANYILAVASGGAVVFPMDAVVVAIRTSDDEADLVTVPRERTDDEILDALYRSLPHPEQMRMHMENQNARENTIDDLRSFLVEIFKASPHAPKTPPPGEG